MIRAFSFFLILGLFLAGNFGCKSYFQHQQFEYLTADHNTIAVLPAKVTHLGKIPEELSRDEIEDIHRAESQAFQMSFYFEILRSTRRGRNNLTVAVQPWQETLRMLEDEGIDILDIHGMNSGELEDILGVDACVNSRIQKTRFMSDLESYGIQVGIHLAGVYGRHHLFPWIPYELTVSKEIQAEYSLVSSNDGVLWSIHFDEMADWSRTSREIIDGISRRAARHFPYRMHS